ncbi:cysteine-rich motor neuron 1 protein-like [Megalops cyprinoides]|uniref:cysteine-rich motor neuron 1 protein-like n=1 Tax=Megalops cyprinoides TaxID=118141 RepID=UPI001864FA6C|nr:cysteine-rich motor neuron 1 protein-like [Megalops cyprinoides]
MHTDWVLLWLWTCWLGLYCPTEGQKQARPGLGQNCDGTFGGRCDTNLTCLPVYVYDYESGTGVCSPATLAPGCIPCSEVKCPRGKRRCPRAHVTDPCGCCSDCARQRGQVCGGPHWERGYCDGGLTCAMLLGQARAMPPQTGVCKVLPGRQPDALADPLCPWVWGCNVRVGNCDCYGVQTCRSYFSYHSLEDCRKSLWDFEHYIPGEDELDKEEPCWEKSCEVEEGQCMCYWRICNPHIPPISKEACEDQLRRGKCYNVSCPEVPLPSCPSDSFLSEPYTPPDHCCPLLPAACTCNFETCPSKPPKCPPGQYAHQLTRGNGRPGTCCHRYLCVPRQSQLDNEKRDEKED